MVVSSYSTKNKREIFLELINRNATLRVVILDLMDSGIIEASSVKNNEIKILLSEYGVTETLRENGKNYLKINPEWIEIFKKEMWV